MWDYDIAILGATPAGLTAAGLAARWGARVALVGVPVAAATAVWNAMAVGDREPDWEALALEAKVGQQVLAQIQGDDAATLAVAGVDWLQTEDLGQFGAAGLHGGLQVGARCLRAQRYLLALSVRSHLPIATGSEGVNYYGPESWLPAAKDHQFWTVLGDAPEAIAWAQRLARWGKSVTLVGAAAQLLPGWIDSEVALALQRILEAAGVRVLLETAVQEMRSRPDGRQEIVTATETWLAEAIFVAGGARLVAGRLNLETVGVEIEAGALSLDRQLRTANSRIFACRTWLGTEIARADAEIATHNALFGRLPWQHRTISPPHGMPRWLPTQPGLAAIGYTEAQAQQRWPGKIRTSTRYLALQPRYALEDATSGLCKLVARRDGRLLGMQLLAAGAEDLLAIAALAQQQNLTVADLAGLAVPELSRARLAIDTARQWLQQAERSPQPSHWLRWQRRWLP